MAKALGSTETLGVACLGITHPHTSGRVRAVQRLGNVLQVRAHAGCSHDEAATSHMNQPEDIGGAMFVISSHLFDRVIHHFGMPLSVNARITKFSNAFGDTSREDAAGAVLNYED